MFPKQSAVDMAAKPLTRSDKTPSDLLDASVLEKVEKKEKKEKKLKPPVPDKTIPPTLDRNVVPGQMDNNLNNPPAPDGATPPPPKDPLVNAVMGEFSSLWETFKNGVESQLLKFSETLNDPKEGLVIRVQNVEKEISQIRDGEEGEKGLTEKLSDFKSRLEAMEAKPLGATTRQAASGESPQEIQGIKARLDALEEKCMTPGSGLCKDVSTVQTQVLELVSILNEIAVKDEEGTVHFKHETITDLLNDVGRAQYVLDIIVGFLHITCKKVDSLEHQTAETAATLMKDSIIFGGVRMIDEESAIDAVKRFITNLMGITVRSRDILAAEQMGKGYSRIINGKEINFPPPVKVCCTERFATIIMDNATSLGGKMDEEGGFK